jgi:rod shape-determining protein MreB and related proteins
MSKEDGDLFVGIDLGTSRSSISTSDGQRHVVESYVGWPVDMVAKKLVKKSVLVGREALDNRPMLDIRRPLERGLLKEGSEKDQQAVRQLLSHLMRLAGTEQVRKNGGKVRAVVGVPAEALRVNKQHLREAIKGFIDGLIIVSEPFAVAYGQDALLHALVVDIGAGTTDFCVMKGRYPTEEDQRTLPNAGDWVDEQLSTLLEEHHEGLNVSTHTVREWKETSGFVGSPPGKVKVQVPIAGKPTEIDITEELKAACEGLVPPVAETLMDLVAGVESEYQAEVRQNVLLSGGTSLMPGLAEALERSMTPFGGGKVRVVEDPVFVGSDGGLALAVDAPKSDWEKLPA